MDIVYNPLAGDFKPKSEKIFEMGLEKKMEASYIAHTLRNSATLAA